MNDRPLSYSQPPRPWDSPAVVGLFLAAWLAVLCLLPDPRPLAAPDEAVRAVRALTGAPEAVSRAAASVALRGIGFGLLGVLTSWTLGGVGLRAAVPLGVVLAAALAVLSQWVSYGHFPVTGQWKVGVTTAAAGALAGTAMRRSRLALVLLALLVTGLYLWGTSTRVSDDLDDAARLTIGHVLSHADEIRPGDDGFADAVYQAFSFAEDNSHAGDPVSANKAAVLALGIVFGDERVAKVARREVDPEWRDGIEALRQRVTLRGRGDTPRHFWVSAGLVVVTDESRATTVGVGKELSDSNPGGSGFSFPDLAANRAGILFALAATGRADLAKAVQVRIVRDGCTADDFCPEIGDLPEGLTKDRFQNEYGGLGGKKTRDLMAAIEERMATKPLLRTGK